MRTVHSIQISKSKSQQFEARLSFFFTSRIQQLQIFLFHISASTMSCPNTSTLPSSLFSNVCVIANASNDLPVVLALIGCCTNTTATTAQSTSDSCYRFCNVTSQTQVTDLNTCLHDTLQSQGYDFGSFDIAFLDDFGGAGSSTSSTGESGTSTMLSSQPLATGPCFAEFLDPFNTTACAAASSTSASGPVSTAVVATPVKTTISGSKTVGAGATQSPPVLPSSGLRRGLYWGTGMQCLLALLVLSRAFV